MEKIGLEPYLLERLIYRPTNHYIRRTADRKRNKSQKIPQKMDYTGYFAFLSQEDSLAEGIQVHHRQNENFQVFYLFNAGLETIETLVEIIGEVENGRKNDICKQQKRYR